ncbi:UNVERIFIED_CONTAM: hypothetical protein NY100_00035 [Prevotella sp. 15_C9]
MHVSLPSIDSTTGEGRAEGDWFSTLKLVALATQRCSLLVPDCIGRSVHIIGVWQ